MFRIVRGAVSYKYSYQQCPANFAYKNLNYQNIVKFLMLSLTIGKIIKLSKMKFTLSVQFFALLQNHYQNVKQDANASTQGRFLHLLALCSWSRWMFSVLYSIILEKGAGFCWFIIFYLLSNLITKLNKFMLSIPDVQGKMRGVEHIQSKYS